MSPVYCDFRVLVSKPGAAGGDRPGAGGEGEGDRLRPDRGDSVCGAAVGVAASIASGIPMIYPRKEVKDYGTKKLIEGAYNAGEKVLVIDDIITDGASARSRPSSRSRKPGWS